MSSKKSNTSDGTQDRVIKKYPNRRLYDTTSSSYVALSDIKQLVMTHAPFRVVDAKSGEDLTRSILLQIILEHESDGAPILTEPVLANIIRFYGHSMQGFMGFYLEKNVQTFMDNVPQTPIVPTLVSSYAEQLQKQTERMMDLMGLKRK
ncbi:polyhydroxyalkanoate synthesis repressor PhaR [Limnohabitans sp.]|uniref:polyhydroxyalkanoate synthesis repressor PhaR n=1 Tax=Limnohabitans sp. TaxID=1907725 RepID=UPI00286EF0FE|nr:polyhydroxyalkanoate synthesis repressor PhaR [Limnohabitans sp.]